MDKFKDHKIQLKCYIIDANIPLWSPCGLSKVSKNNCEQTLVFSLINYLRLTGVSLKQFRVLQPSDFYHYDVLYAGMYISWMQGYKTMFKQILTRCRARVNRLTSGSGTWRIQESASSYSMGTNKSWSVSLEFLMTKIQFDIILRELFFVDPWIITQFLQCWRWSCSTIDQFIFNELRFILYIRYETTDFFC